MCVYEVTGVKISALLSSAVTLWRKHEVLNWEEGLYEFCSRWIHSSTKILNICLCLDEDERPFGQLAW